jgi:hypothetical protein
MSLGSLTSLCLKIPNTLIVGHTLSASSGEACPDWLILSVSILLLSYSSPSLEYANAAANNDGVYANAASLRDDQNYTVLYK